nr:retrovirus-related Pol polyprotein from transposon TNT 1-94 [Tanacetum cinerariifolium]
ITLEENHMYNVAAHELNGTTEVPPAVVLNTTNATSAGATSDTPLKVAFDACNTTTTTDSWVMQHTLTTYQPVTMEEFVCKRWIFGMKLGSNVYVKNIDKLQECFSQCGTITTLGLLLKEKGTSNRFGFVCFSTPEAVTPGMTRAKNKITTLAEHIIVAGAENHPQLLEKSMYDSWASRIRLFIKGKKCGRMMHDSIDNGPLVYPSVEETRLMKYSELNKAQQLQNDYDVQATNIILHGLPPNVYALVNYQEAAKDIWDRVKLLMKGTELSYQECEFRITRERYLDPLALVANSPTLYNPSQSPQHSVFPQPFIPPSVTQHSQANFPQLNSGLAVPTFQQGKYPIECINKAMAFLSVVASRFPPLNNQLIWSSNPRNQATIQDGRVTVQQFQGRQSQSFVSTRNRGTATTSRENYAAGEGHMARQCTQRKRPRTAAWFKEKLMLAEAQEVGQILDEEQLAFLADPRISEAPVSQQTIPQNSTFQTEDLDAYDSDCDDLSSAKAVLMVNLSSCDSDVLSEVPYFDSSSNDMINQKESQDAVIQDTNYSEPNDLLELSLVEQMIDHVAHLDKENHTNKIITTHNFPQQAFWLKHSSFFETPVKSHITVRIEAPSELPKDNFRENQYAPTFNQLFELNEFKAQSQEKDTVIRKLTDMIKSLSGKDSVENVKKYIDEIETINIELGNSVVKLLSENKIIRKEREHLKLIFKDQFDSIKKTCVQSKEHCDSLISQINAKSVENLDLNAQLQEKLDIEPISRRLKNNRDDHEVYLEKTVENTNTLRGLVECTFPSLTKPFEKLVAVTLMNKDKKVRFAEPVTSSSNIPKQTDSLNTKDSNKPLLTSTGVKPTTSASGSKPSVATPTQGILVYSRRPKATRSVGSTSKVKIKESKTSNSMKPKQSWGSTVFDVPSSSLNDCRLFKLFSVKDYTQEKTLSAAYGYLRADEDSKYQWKDILVIVDDYSRFTWVKFLCSKDEVSEFMIKYLKMIQVRLNATVCNIRTDNGIEFVKHTLKAYYEEVKISHQTSMARTSQQNGPMFDEYLNPLPCVDPQVLAVIASEPAISTSTPSSTITDQDAPSTSTSQTPPEIPSPSYKGALTESCWIEAMQEEPNEFERLEVKELVPRPVLDTPMVEKSKLDEDPQGKAIDPTRYRGMIGTLVYLTASRHDIVFSCACVPDIKQSLPKSTYMRLSESFDTYEEPLIWACGIRRILALLLQLLQMLTMRVSKIPEKVRLEVCNY